MLLKRFDDVRAYASHLWRDAREVRALHDDLLIQVTGFFRDAGGIESLARHVFPALVKKRHADAPDPDLGPRLRHGRGSVFARHRAAGVPR